MGCLGLDNLNNDILKSLHNNNVTSTYSVYPPNNINQSLPTQGYITQPIKYAPAPAPSSAPAQITHTQPRQQPSPLFQRIELQIPNKSPHIKPMQGMSQNILPNTVPKINLGIGKPANASFVYTELPPELQNFTPPVYNISSAEAPVMMD